MLKNSKFYFMILAYLFFGGYVLCVAIATPLIQIELTKSNGTWVVKDLFYKEWAEIKNLSIGDIILEVDQIPANELSHLDYSPYIRGAGQITFQNQTNEIVSIDVLHRDLSHQLYIQIFFPFIHYILIFTIALYLFYKKKEIVVIDLLIYFILVMSLAYISSGASARLDYIGILVNSSCLLLCVVVFLHFLKHYFQFLNIQGLFPKRFQLLYVLPFIALICRGIGILYPALLTYTSLVVLTLFALLVVYVTVVLLCAYRRYKLPELKLLGFGLMLPFLPFLLCYVIPEVVWGTPVFGADICAFTPVD